MELAVCSFKYPLADLCKYFLIGDVAIDEKVNTICSQICPICIRIWTSLCCVWRTIISILVLRSKAHAQNHATIIESGSFHTQELLYGHRRHQGKYFHSNFSMRWGFDHVMSIDQWSSLYLIVPVCGLNWSVTQHICVRMLLVLHGVSCTYSQNVCILVFPSAFLDSAV